MRECGGHLGTGRTLTTRLHRFRSCTTGSPSSSVLLRRDVVIMLKIQLCVKSHDICGESEYCSLCLASISSVIRSARKIINAGVERRTVSRGDGSLMPPAAVLKQAISFTPHLPVSFGRDTKSRWSLLSGV